MRHLPEPPRLRDGEGRSEVASVHRRWRYYQSAAGRRPAYEFIKSLDTDDRATVLAGMVQVRDHGLDRARHLRGEVYEVRVYGHDQAFRILFAAEGSKNRVLLALEGFSKRTQQTPIRMVELAERRLRDWRTRG